MDCLVISVQSAEMSTALHEMGIKTTLWKYDNMTHSDFVIDWPAVSKKDTSQYQGTDSSSDYHSNLVDSLLR